MRSSELLRQSTERKSHRRESLTSLNNDEEFIDIERSPTGSSDCISKFRRSNSSIGHTASKKTLTESKYLDFMTELLSKQLYDNFDQILAVKSETLAKLREANLSL
jgi:hypothetical protein